MSQEKNWINNDIFFSMHLSIVGDFVITLIHVHVILATKFANVVESEKNSASIRFICKLFARRSYYL